MPVRIKSIEPDSIAAALGWKSGAQIVSVNGRSVADEIDFRFQTSEERLDLKVRIDGVLTEHNIEKDPYEPLGIELEEFRIKHCGDDCIFCFVDQNPPDLREALYFRDGDYRMSFLYGNYITMTNLRQRDLDRIIEQRLSPLYISVHCTDDDIRRTIMGHRTQDDRLMEKLQFFRSNGIEMHAQIVLVPGYNDGQALEKTIEDLYELNDALHSVSIVPIGLTRHREGLADLRTVRPGEAKEMITRIAEWQSGFRTNIGRGFVYLSDEWYLLAGEPFPQEEHYDGYPLMENGVGMCRDFQNEFDFQAGEFPAGFEHPRKLTMITSQLPYPVLDEGILPRLSSIPNLDVQLIKAQNTLFGDPVTVSGLLSYQCFERALDGTEPGNLVLLPPDCVNFEGLFLDNVTGKNSPEDLSQAIGTATMVFSGDWIETLNALNNPT